MVSFSSDLMLLIGALSGIVGFANVILPVCYGIIGLFNPPTFDMGKVKLYSDEEWPPTGDI